MALKTTLTTTIGVIGLLPMLLGADHRKIVPTLENDELVLFDAETHGLDTIRNYTATWKEGSNLIPVTEQVTRNGEQYVEISYRKERGTAMSLIAFENVPKPAEGFRYDGLKLVFDYDSDDYSHISMSAAFSDNTQLTTRLTLEKGKHDYRVTDGFRRAKFPPKWDLLIWVRLAVDTNSHGHDKNVVYRLQGISLCREEIEKRTAETVTFGDRVLSPQPKQTAWRKDAFPARTQTAVLLPGNASSRTKRTAEIFRRKYCNHTGVELPLRLSDGPLPTEGIVLQVAKSAEFGGVTTELKPEGYCLVVEPNRVIITGADEPGLYYGGVTFFQLLKSPMRIEDSMPVPCVEILDWPDMRNRLCRLEHPHHFKNRTLKENRGIDFLIEWTDRFVAGNKLNVFFLDLSAITFYKRRPEFNGSERMYTLEDLRKFGQFCRDNFIDLCPAWQIGGHANWWLTIGYHPELKESGWRSQGDVTHPQHDEIVYDCMLDVIEALQPKYVSPKSDEWWHTRLRDKPLQPLLHGKTRSTAFLDFHAKLGDWLRGKGITMMIYHDMITPYHNGKRFDTYRVVDDFPKDAIVLHWSSPDDIPKWFAKKGLAVWMNPTGMRLIPEGMESFVTGYGKGMYSFGDTKKMPSELRATTNMYTLFRAADHAWNLTRDNRLSWEDLVTSGPLVAVRNQFAVRPNPYAGERIRPLDIRAQMNRRLSAFLKQAKPETYGKHDNPVVVSGGEKEIGFVPTTFGPEEGNNCVVVRKGDTEVSMPIEGYYSSLIFLHTAHLDSRDGIIPTTYRRWPYGFPCGDYIIRYDDGKEAVSPLRFEYNIRRFDVPTVNRATNDNRHIHTLKDVDGNDVHLFQWEWVNPRPDKKIIQVIARHDDELDVSLVLFAVSGRDVAKLE